MKKTPVRRFKTYLIKKGLCYSVPDISRLFGVDESAVYRWIRNDGLIPIDNKSPFLIAGATLKQFLDYKNDNLKMPSGNEGELPCFKCRLKRKPLKDEVIICKTNSKVWALKAICEICGRKMNMNVSAGMELVVEWTWGYKVFESLPKIGLIVGSNPSALTTRRSDISKNTFIPLPLRLDPENERVKYEYYDKILNRFGKDKKTLKSIIYSLNMFEEITGFQSFKFFNYEVAKSFNNVLLKTKTGRNSHNILRYTREFLVWLQGKNGYKKLLTDDILTLRLSKKDNIIQRLSIEEIKRRKKLKDDPKFQFLLSQIDEDNLDNLIKALQ